MATILEFRALDEKLLRSRRLKGGSGEVVIFPGIRYERRLERDVGSETRKTVPVRDMLKLLD